MLESYQKIALDISKFHLSEGDSLTFRVDGNSMMPLIKPGDQVSMIVVSPENLHKGDLVVVRRDSEAITHRFVAKDSNGKLMTKGDRTPIIDPVIDNESIIGRVIAIESNGSISRLDSSVWRTINRFLGSMGWWEAMAYGFLVLLVGKIFGDRSISRFFARFLVIPFRIPLIVISITRRVRINDYT